MSCIRALVGRSRISAPDEACMQQALPNRNVGRGLDEQLARFNARRRQPVRDFTAKRDPFRGNLGLNHSDFSPMTLKSRNLAVLGSTGSIGTSTLDVVRDSAGILRLMALSAHSNLDLLVEQAREFRPRYIVATDADTAGAYRWPALPGIERLIGPSALEQVVRDDSVDSVVAAIVGSAGLASTWAAVECGKRVSLANKETLVVAGPLVCRKARETGAELIPVDSEHSAIFQASQAGRRDEIERVILTASGGPFRDFASDQFASITVEQALQHPTWSMGRKITVDSATMMNKALEIIEARWLFDIEVDKIVVMVHPQSIVHSMVEFVDGSVLAQLSPPDMKLPIQYALMYPDRIAGPASRMDWASTMQWDFGPPNTDLFPALQLGRDVARAGGTAGAVLNAANEAAVARFLAGDLHFTEIVPACRSILEHHEFEPNPSLDRLHELDRWARKELRKWTVC